MRRPATLLVALGALFAAVPAAQASTLSQDGSGVLTYQAAAAIDNDIYLDQDDTTASTLSIDTANDPVTGTLPANCTDPADPDTGETIVCTGVSRIVLNTLDGEDYIEAWDEVESLPITADLGADDDDIDSGNGDDTIVGGDGDDELYGDFSGCPGCAGAGGNDTLDGGPGDDWVAGGLGNDTVNGGDGNDGAVGGTGDDTISGGAGDDNYVGGGAGNDTVSGDAGADYVFGDCEGPCNQGRPGGNDTVNGGDGDDYLAGDDGNDTINGDAGEDTLATDQQHVPVRRRQGSRRAIPGDDNWNGGSGIDTIEYNAYGYDNAIGDNYAIDVRVTLRTARPMTARSARTTT